MKPKLTLTFDAGFGEKYSMCIGIEEYISNEMRSCPPPSSFPGAETFDSVVHKIKAREFRKDKFIGESTRLGALLAERMEDAEGWNDSSRIESAKEQLRGSG